jgi:hypothetical protein
MSDQQTTDAPGLMSPLMVFMLAALMTVKRLPKTPAGDRAHAMLAAKVETLANEP